MKHIFVYGTLKRNYIPIPHTGMEYIGDAVSYPKYSMYDLVYFPAIVRGGNTSIHGEVFSVTKDALEFIDGYEGDLYTKETDNFMLSGGGIIKCYVYIFNQNNISYINRQINSGKWEGE